MVMPVSLLAESMRVSRKKKAKTKVQKTRLGRSIRPRVEEMTFGLEEM